MNRNKDIKHIRGDSFTFNFSLKDDNGAVIDITGSTIELDIYTSAKATSPIHTVDHTNHSDPTNGVSVFTILPSVTAEMRPYKYYYTLRITLSDGSKYTIIYGTWDLLSEINESN